MYNVVKNLYDISLNICSLVNLYERERLAIYYLLESIGISVMKKCYIVNSLTTTYTVQYCDKKSLQNKCNIRSI